MKQRFIRFGVRLYAVSLLLTGAAVNLNAQAELPDYAVNEGISEWPEQDSNDDYLYFDLGCNSGAWSGYFAPQRWSRQVKNEPQATLPPSLTQLSEGGIPGIAFEQAREFTESWSIEIPVPGYLSFCLQPPPLSGESAVAVVINDQETDYLVRSDGLYYSPYLQRGDKFSLRIPAGMAVYYWSKLVFHSNFHAVIVRPGAKTDEQKYLAISQGSIQRVFFPSDAPGTWPVFDEDGDRSTIYDQTELRSSDDRFEVEYTDNQILNDGKFTLERTFTIREKCTRANWLKRSRVWCTLPLIVD